MICKIEGCKNNRYLKYDVCRKHFYELYNNKKCDICGSKSYVFYNKKVNMMLCNKHTQQIKRCEKILTRTILTPNEFIIHNDCVEILLFDINNNLKNSTFIDYDDYEKCKEYKWRLNSMGYVVSGAKSEILLHRFVMNVDEKQSIDHIDRNKLNNRKSNLRIASQNLNTINKSRQSNNTSGIVGISWNTEKKGWDVQLKKGDFKYNKRFKEFDNSVKARLVSESIYFKEYSPNYNPSTNTIQLTYLSHDDNKETFIEVDMEGNIKEFKKL